MIFLYCLPLIIFIHELGHLLAAKWCKCGVEIFSIGFGKPFFKFDFNNTTYQISPFLLGGYCKLDKEIEFSRKKTAFTNKTYSQKLFISFAGVLMNVITGLWSYWLFTITHNFVFFLFSFYSISIGLTNLLPIPALDGSFWIAFLFEKKLGKKKLYGILKSLFGKWFKFFMIVNAISLPYLFWMIYKGQIL
jgi:membrane-associated protease RseP (regulator of RpoE activity)